MPRRLAWQAENNKDFKQEAATDYIPEGRDVHVKEASIWRPVLIEIGLWAYHTTWKLS